MGVNGREDGNPAVQGHSGWISIVFHFRRSCFLISFSFQSKSILIINGAGGVGSIAIQIARKVLNLQHVIATASRPGSKSWCEKAGATAVIDHKQPLQPQIEALGLSTIDYALVGFDPDLFMDQLAALISPLVSCE